jgi:tetratricopeptide (TPR) repeat protein
VDKLSFAIVTAITAFISLDTMRRLYVDRHRFSKEDLNDYDLAFVWRIVIFLIYPLLNLFSMWVTVIVCQCFGGYVQNMSYGLLWYQVIPDELSSRTYLIPTLFAGELAQTALVLVLLLALLFRPHPFLAMLITYVCTFVLSINLIVDPILSLLGFGSAHWQIAMSQGSKEELFILLFSHFALAIIFVALVNSEIIQKAFAELIRPVAMARLKTAIAQIQSKRNLVSLCNLVILYEAAGLTRQASKKMKEIKANNSNALLARFIEAYLSYKRRNFKQALKLFLTLADHLALNSELKSMLLSAAACSTHAMRDFPRTADLIERALEFDYHNALARMLKIDICLKQGNEEKAALEFQLSSSNGLDQNVDPEIPIDWQKAVSLICDVDTCNEENSDHSKSAKQGPSPLL